MHNDRPSSLAEFMAGRWQPMLPPADVLERYVSGDHAAGESSPTALTVLTFNVWLVGCCTCDTISRPPVRGDPLTRHICRPRFDKSNKKARFDGLLSLIAERAPDVICLQEMTLPTQDWLMQHPYIREHYQVCVGVQAAGL